MQTISEILNPFSDKKYSKEDMQKARKKAIEEVSKLAVKCLEDTYGIDYLQDTDFPSLIKELK